jgi:hypothetical protein
VRRPRGLTTIQLHRALALKVRYKDKHTTAEKRDRVVDNFGRGLCIGELLTLPRVARSTPPFQ